MKTVNCLERQGEELQTNIGDNAIEFCEEEVEEVLEPKEQKKEEERKKLMSILVTLMMNCL